MNLRPKKDAPTIVHFGSAIPKKHWVNQFCPYRVGFNWYVSPTWGDLVSKIEHDAKFISIHSSILREDYAPTELELIDAINTLAGRMPRLYPLRIAVTIDIMTPMSMVRNLKRAKVFGLLLDPQYYELRDVEFALKSLINDVPYWPKEIINKLPRSKKAKDPREGIALTSRQTQVLRLIKDRGASNKVIAKALGISESTVKLHVAGIFKKYGVRSRTQLAVLSPE